MVPIVISHPPHPHNYDLFFVVSNRITHPLMDLSGVKQINPEPTNRTLFTVLT